MRQYAHQIGSNRFWCVEVGMFQYAMVCKGRYDSMRSNMLTRSRIRIMDSQVQGDALDTALAIGSGFDWITPLVSLLSHSNVTQYNVPARAYPDVAILFKRYRIPVYNVFQIGDLVCFDVPKSKVVLVDRLFGRR